jgi:hypothetical protein
MGVKPAKLSQEHQSKGEKTGDPQGMIKGKKPWELLVPFHLQRWDSNKVTSE